MKKYLFYILTILSVTGCAKYSSEEIEIFDENIKKLIGTTLYTCKGGINAEEYIITDAYFSSYGAPINIKTNKGKCKDWCYGYEINDSTFYNKQNSIKFCSKEEYANSKNVQRRTYILNAIKNIDTYLSETKDPKNIIVKYIDIINPITLAKLNHRENYRSYKTNDEYQIDLSDIDLSSIQKVIKNKKDLKCFVKRYEYSNDYENNTDGCILIRRNSPKEEILFNYSKYLPQIKNDLQFSKVLHTFDKYYSYEFNYDNKEYEIKNSYCENLKEITSVEREECKKDVDIFFYQTLNNTIPHCRNKKNKKYKEALKQAINLSSSIYNLYQMLNNNNEIQSENNFVNMLTYETINKEMENFGSNNFCSVKNWGADLKK